MVSLQYSGRLGNNLIQHLVALFFSQKYNLKLNFSQNTWGNFFKEIDLNSSISGNDFYEVTDSNFIELFEKPKIDSKHYFFNGFFQKKFFFQKYETELKKLINFNHTYIDKNSVFIHYRIGDISDDRRMLPIEYYEDALSNINFSNGYISSDSIEHIFCKNLIKKYNLIPVTMNPFEVINFGKNFNNIILSEGTFSWWIGFLSNAENIICNKRNYFWHGDIFFDRWKKISWDYEHETIFDNYKLNDYKPKKLC